MEPSETKHRSFWLEELRGDAPNAPSLIGGDKSDIAILGGGYVGLWTAIRIKQAEPGCDVVVLEQDICGGGASGRNGGFVLSWAPKVSSLSRLFGVKDAARICSHSVAAIEEIRAFCEKHKIDADFRQGGWMWTATSNAQLDAWDKVISNCERAGISQFRRVDPAEVARRTGSRAHRAGVFESTAAIVQPAALARGLRRVALGMGVRIYENTKVLSFGRNRPVVVKAKNGELTSDRLVIATNAWAAGIRELGRAIAVLSSDMIVTEPIPERVRKIGWESDLSITDSQTMVDYYRLTRHGRVAFGKGGWTIAYGGNIGEDFDRHSMRASEVAADFRRYYPALKDVEITHDWSGPIDRTPDSLPLIGYLGGREHIVYGVGWSGNGVGPSVIGGKVLASMCLGRKDEWGTYPLIGRRAGGFPPEPIKYIGAHIVRAAVASKERAEIFDKRPSVLAAQLSKLAPSGLEDKE